MKKLANSAMVLASLLTVATTLTMPAQAVAQDAALAAQLAASQNAHVEVSKMLHANTSRGSVVALEYSLANVDGNLARHYLNFDLSAELKSDIALLRQARISEGEELVKMNASLTTRAGRVTANPLLQKGVDDAKAILARNRGRMLQIRSDMGFLDDLENLALIDKNRTMLRPDALKRLQSMTVSEMFVIESEESIAKILTRAQEIDLSTNKKVGQVSVLKFKVDLPALATAAPAPAVAAETRLQALRRTVSEALKSHQKPVRISAIVGAGLAVVGVTAWVVYSDVQVQKTEENLAQ